MHTQKLAVQVGQDTMSCYLAVPDGVGPFPAVIVFEEIFGINSHIRDVTERVAKEGYLAIAPDIHHRAAPPDMELKYDDEGRKQGMPLIGKLTVDGVLADVSATLGFLRARMDVIPDHIGCMGFCIGGHLAYLTAATSDVKATAAFYGGGIAVFGLGAPAPTVTRTPSIKGKIVCFFGGQDSAIPADQVATIRKALEDNHIRHEVVVYPDASHGFFCDQRGSYNPTAAADAWERTKRLFAEELR
jgi:carboxymethylenebutenolidase